MEGLPKRFKLFFILVTATAIIVLGWNILHTDWNKVLIIHVLIFGILGIVSESLPVALPKGGYVTVSYPIFLSALILFPLGVTLTAVVLSGMLIFGNAGIAQSLYKRVFNASQYILSVAVARVIMNICEPSSFQINPKFLIMYAVAAIIFMVLNVTFQNN